MKNTIDRSSRREVRNPVLRLESAQALQALPSEAREALRLLLVDLRADALATADQCWKKHKGPMAAYWKAVGVYSGHIAKVLK